MGLVQADLGGVQIADGALGAGELGLGRGRPVPGLGDGGGQALHLVGAGGQPGPGGVHLPGQLGQALPAIGDEPCGGGQFVVGGPQRLFPGGAVLGGLRELVGGRVDRLDQRLVFGLGPLGPRLQLVGVAPGLGRVPDRGGQVPGPFVGQRDGAPHPLGQRGQCEPGLLRPDHGRAQLAQLGLGRLQPFGGLGQVALHPVAMVDGGLLVDRVLLYLSQDLHQVVGQQPHPGVPQVGLHPRGPPRDRGLPAQRAELPADLGGQVGEPVEIGLHRVELADRLLAPLAVLEDAGGLLDERPSVLRPGLQHGIQLALPDDDVHLPADAGVGQQFLDVQQPAGAAVDLVLADAVAEHPPGDRHLGVVDGQRPVGVVDGERDLGAAQRGAVRRAGEDDVLHLAAAQRLGALLTQHPGDRVHHVRLARPVRPDHRGDARFQAQRGRRRERLETLHREGLQVHSVGPSCSVAPRSAGAGSPPGDATGRVRPSPGS